MHTIPEILGPYRVDIRNVVILVIGAQIHTNNRGPPLVWQGMIQLALSTNRGDVSTVPRQPCGYTWPLQESSDPAITR